MPGEDRLVRRLGFVYGELLGRYPDDSAVLPFNHRQAEAPVGENCLQLPASCIPGLFDGLVLGVKPVHMHRRQD